MKCVMLTSSGFVVVLNGPGEGPVLSCWSRQGPARPILCTRKLELGLLPPSSVLFRSHLRPALLPRALALLTTKRTSDSEAPCAVLRAAVLGGLLGVPGCAGSRGAWLIVPESHGQQASFSHPFYEPGHYLALEQRQRPTYTGPGAWSSSNRACVKHVETGWMGDGYCWCSLDRPGDGAEAE